MGFPVGGRPRRLQAWVLGWVADYPDPQNFLDVLFHQRQPGATRYSSADVDGWLEAAPDRRTAVEQLELAGPKRILAVVALVSVIETWLVAPTVHNFTVPPIVDAAPGADLDRAGGRLAVNRCGAPPGGCNPRRRGWGGR
ncbi:MAG: hypothetical protein U0470_09955 [Anaerolineae bacterium]